MQELTLKQIENKKYILEQNIKELIDKFHKDVQLNFDIDLNITKESIVLGETKYLCCNPKVKLIL